MNAAKPRYQYDATDIHFDRTEDGTAVLSILTNGDIDFSVCLTAQLAEQLRTEIAFPKAR